MSQEKMRMCQSLPPGQTACWRHLCSLEPSQYGLEVVETGEGWWACLGITHHWFCSPTGLERMKKGDGKPDTNLEGP